ncbi:hypothetical protein GQ53DRAFT_678747 [Thozetella sp. PMI_491]|nr:hypothetical protein GQ53DRAFT_678747 [Thozetella sp. PMI_491]
MVSRASEAPEDCEHGEHAEREVAELERLLQEAKERLRQRKAVAQNEPSSASLQQTQALKTRTPSPPREQSFLLIAPLTSSNHFLLLLSDSALPLGSFAFSSGLESYLAHNRSRTSSSPASFNIFLPISLSSYASTTLPFALAAHRDPATVADLDDALDAAIVCTVGRRASIAQGRALLSIWERSLVASVPSDTAKVLKPFSLLLKASSASGGSAPHGWGDPPAVSAHLAPLFGAICNLVGLSLAQTAYVFLLGHVKALVSAAVRASMFGPYQAQKVLASGLVKDLINAMVEREWETRVEEAGQSIPVMDLWIGRHEVLYSRIFNS